MKTKVTSLVAAMVLIGCGGSGDDSPGVAVEPPPPNNPSPAPAPTPAAPVPPPATPPAPPPPVAAVPPPVTAPVNPNPVPVPPPAGSNEQPPPAPPPQPAEGTYVLGKVVKEAIRLGTLGADSRAYEVVNGKPNTNSQPVYIGSYLGSTAFNHYAYPSSYDYNNPNPKFPQSQAIFDVNYLSGWFTLGRAVRTYSNSVEKVLVRSEDFEIRDDFKFILDTSAASWTGVEGEPWFVQLQVASWHPKGATTGPASDHAFKLCLHQYFPGVRRLACTVHNRDTGEYIGTQILDDSRGLGTTEYLPSNQ